MLYAVVMYLVMVTVGQAQHIKVIVIIINDMKIIKLNEHPFKEINTKNMFPK